MIDRNTKKAQMLVERINKYQHSLNQTEYQIKELQNKVSQTKQPCLLNQFMHKLDIFKKRAEILNYKLDVCKNMLKELYENYTPLTCNIRQLERKQLSDLL